MISTISDEILSLVGEGGTRWGTGVKLYVSYRKMYFSHLGVFFALGTCLLSMGRHFWVGIKAYKKINLIKFAETRPWSPSIKNSDIFSFIYKVASSDLETQVHELTLFMKISRFEIIPGEKK